MIEQYRTSTANEYLYCTQAARYD